MGSIKPEISNFRHTFDLGISIMKLVGQPFIPGEDHSFGLCLVNYQAPF